MGMKENFKMAVKELLPGEESADIGVQNTEKASEPLPEIRTPERPVSSAQRTEIAAGVTVRGTIHGAGSVDIHGQWIGNIDIEEDLRLYGSLGGDLTARSLLLKGGRIRGNVRVAERAEIDKDSVVLGNIHAGEMTLQGRVKGDVTVKGQLALGTSAMVAGQITAGSISVATGAALQGQVRIATAEADKLFRETEEGMKDLPADANTKTQ